MKIRTKFTLWIALASVLSILCLCSFLYYEINDEFFEVVDFELATYKENVFDQIESKKTIPSPEYYDSILTTELFWVKLFDNTGRLLYANRIAALADIPLENNGNPYLFKSNLSVEQIWFPPEEKHDLAAWDFSSVPLRVQVFTKTIHEIPYTLQIGKPVLLFKIELLEGLFKAAGIALVTIIIIIATSYCISKYLLRPLTMINRMIKEIRGNSLDTRIPADGGKDELQTLVLSLNSMFDHLQESFARQKEFISNASHELKSPLTILLIGQEDLLASNPPEHIRNELVKQLTVLQRMQQLVRNLLDLSRLEHQDRLHFSEIKLDELLEKILHEYQELLDIEKISTTVHLESVTLHADRLQIQRLISNLIDNAIKFCAEPDGKIDISLIKRDTCAQIFITNNGRTIPEEELNLIFNQFYRIEKSRAKAYGGTGLGLTIAKRIVDLHHGSLTVTSEKNETVFVVTLPTTHSNMI